MSQPPQDQTSATACGDDELIAALADEFAARLRRREHPTVEEYVAKHPALAERIRKVLSAVAMIEQTRPLNFTSAAEGAGSTIGRYKLLERIGEGGFGVVYMAEQLAPVRRKVALKVVKPGMDSRQVLARFEAERQALAIMDHLNIAKVLDAGATDSGRPYFVMELVKGEPITEYCDYNQIPPRTRLELFVQVCHAVQHAHQKGIIHRDIKPSNVLVMMHDTTPVVKVIDFGVAKALGQELTEKTLFTGFAQLVGTPLYMSPEQAGQSALDVDTRSDIYSLGVLLYELLTGTTPFDKERFRRAAQDEIRRIIREEEPPRPSTRLSESKESLASISAQRHTEPAKLTKLVRGELDWIVMKALEKDRARRYETANGLARDIERYLHDEPVVACPPSSGYRFRKFARRNKRALWVASVMFGMLLVLVAGLTVSNVRVARERNQKATALTQREEALSAARASAERAEAERQRAESNFVKARTAVTSILARAATGQGEWSQLPPGLRQVFSDETARYYQSLIQEGSVEPAVRYETAVGYRSLGSLHSSAKDFEKAEKYYRQSIQMLEALLSESGNHVEYRHQLAWTSSLLGGILKATTRPAEAQQAYERSAELYEGLLAQAPDSPGYPVELLKSYDALLQLNPAGHASADIRRTRERAAKALEKAVAADPNNAALHARLGNFLRTEGKIEQAIAACRKAIELDPRNVSAHISLGAMLCDNLQEYDQAIACFRKAIALAPNNADAHHNVGVALCGQQKFDEAAIAFRKSIELNPKSAHAYGSLASALAQQDKLDEAVAALRKGVELEPNNASVLRNLGGVLERQKKFDEAIMVYGKMIALDHESAEGRNQLIAALEKSMELSAGGNSADWFFLAMAQWQRGDQQAARQWYGKAVQWMDKNAPANEELIRFRSEAAELWGGE